jgi:hypothetical protein
MPQSLSLSFFHSQISSLDSSRSHRYGSYCHALKVNSKNQNKQSKPYINHRKSFLTYDAALENLSMKLISLYTIFGV